MTNRYALIALCLFGCGLEQRGNNVEPVAAATKWLADTKTTSEGAPSCTGGDTDHDGYVTCLVRRPKTDQEHGEFLSLQCAVLGAGATDGCAQPESPYTSGCKLTAMTKQ